MSILRHSACHFAPIMPEEIRGKSLESVPHWIERCSFCGEVCELVPSAHVIDLDLELTLRRWRDGDCSLADMFARVNTELQRSWQEAFNAGKEALQIGEPKYKLNPYMDKWEATDEQS